MTWEEALASAGTQNASRELPTEGILLTFRLKQNVLGKIERLVQDLKADALAKLLVVVALDDKDYDKPEAVHLRTQLEQICKVFFIRNPPRGKRTPFPICRVWNTMAIKAFEEGADWVVLLGDDV
jgi:hypothetical protein